MAPLRGLSATGWTWLAGRRVVLLVAALAAGATLLLGSTSLGQNPTEEQSEKIAFREARRIAAGEHRFGIVRYTHYPNGPTYLMAAMGRAGLGREAMRALPLAASAASVGFLVYALGIRTRRLALRAFTAAACGVLVLQPAFVQWQGALHEHSYALSLALFAIAASALLPPRNGWLLAPLGFAAGWIGYDWLPGQALVVLGTRFLVYGRDGSASPAVAAAGAVLDAAKFTSGVALAVLTHLAQLGLYFGSFEQAARDLLGSAALRAGADQAGRILPEYSQKALAGAAQLQRTLESRPEFLARLGTDFSTTDPQRLGLPGILLQLFLQPRWSIAWLLAATGATGLLVTLREGLAAVRERDDAEQAAPLGGQRLAAVAAVAIVFALAAGVTWALLMPQHGATHLHMLPRHLLMSVALLVALPALLVPDPGEPASGDALGIRSLLRPLLLYSIPPIVTAFVYLYALVSLG